MNSLRTVIQELPTQLALPQEMSFPISARLRYEPSDPYAIHVTFFTVDSDETKEWIIGRDLLIDGLKGPAGEGDVHIWPVDKHKVRAILRPPAGTATLEASSREIRAFLKETETVVPRGTESEHIDVSALLAHFLGEN
ncbi:SsgA family sporulation/cell division regulator [Streptomyces sp. NPDC051956]|uniref:SsgA family sporulation/cell division regulator n=1 Tax=Streptomyces sp. NPDC051956 TaxID=3365677 RepID=UPI0037D6C950